MAGCDVSTTGGVPIDTHPMSHRGREFYTQVWHRHIGRGELPLSIVTASEIVRVLFFTARFIRHVPTTHSDSDDLNFLYIFSWLEKVNESKLIVQPDELDDVNELEPSKNTTRRVQKWEVLKSPRDVSFFFLLFVSFQQRLVCVYIWEGKFPSVSLCQTGVACGRVDDVVVWFFAPFSLQFSSSLSSCSPKLVGSESRTHVDDELCRVPTRESLVVCVELIAPEAPLRAIVNSVPLFQVSCSLFVLRVVLFCLFVEWKLRLLYWWHIITCS